MYDILNLMVSYLVKLRDFAMKRNMITLYLLFVCAMLIFAYAYIYRYNSNPNLDTVSYLSIASQYSEGLFKSAVDTYWSPMISWLIAPLLALGLDGPSAFALVNASAAVLSLYLASSLINFKSHSIAPRLALIIVIAPILCVFTREFTPDLLVVAWTLGFVKLLIYFDSKFRNKYSLKTSLIAGSILGFYGAIGYVTKLFLLFFFVATCLAWLIYRLFGIRTSGSGSLKTDYTKLTVLGVVIFLNLVVFMSPWVGVMSLKYDRFVLGTALNQNAEYLFVSDTHKVNTNNSSPERVSLYKPYDQHDTSNAEGRPATFGSRQNLELSGETILGFIGKRVDTALNFASTVTETWYMILPVMILSTAIVVWSIIKIGKLESVYAFVYIAMIIYFGGYFIATPTSNTRYLWPLAVLGAILLILNIKLVLKKDSYVYVGAAIFLVGSYIWHEMPTVGNYLTKPEPRVEYQLASYLQENTVENFEGKKLAGNVRSNQFLLAYSLGMQTYGSIRGSNDYRSPEVTQLLRDNRIDYFIQYTPEGEKSYRLENAPIDAVEISVYSVDKYTCRDVKYGKHGDGIPLEPCVITLYKLR